MTQPLDAIQALEFDVRCAGCLSPAAWMVSVAHGLDHQPAEEFLCASHKEVVEHGWLKGLGGVCDCGTCFSDTLDDLYRAVAL